ncbi:hypothetical protein MMP65_18645 [Acinetobacter sp. ANC 3926]|uniref:hypothetical protein n=1 Tax=Acinetobacter genomosp. 15BJ TaxID=106651 RepID=UPI001F4ABDF6|nr:hypothetical protein [Acinetobacter genomosp. 15BJ]MCH7293466.1 hypothetical protein [Acinetobacter genomosp. 15BJ]
MTKEQKDQYNNLIWDTSVSKYKSKDGENADIVKAVQGYKLSVRTSGIMIALGANPFLINGTAPIK